MEETTNDGDVLEPKRRIWLGIGLFLALIALVAYFGSARDDETVGAGMKIAEVTDGPSEFAGRTVTVTAEVESVLAPTAFIISDGADEMLVVATSSEVVPSKVALSEVADIRVVGEVRPFDPKMLTDAGLPATDERLKELGGKPMLVASQVVIPPSELEEHAQASERD